jgi:hypothetical protein
MKALVPCGQHTVLRHEARETTFLQLLNVERLLGIMWCPAGGDVAGEGSCNSFLCRLGRTVRSVILWDLVTAVTAKPAVLKPAITTAERLSADTAGSDTIFK